MKRRSNLSGIIALVFACLMLSACTGSITGQVYIDSNGDGVQDSGEKGLAYAKVVVTREGETIAEHYTDAEGYFDIPVKRKPGEICVSTDLSFAEANIDYILYSQDPESGGAAMAVAPPKAMGAKAATTDDDEEEDEEEDEDEVTTETDDTSSSAQGWTGLKYCRSDSKSQGGFEVAIPVSMDYEGAIADLPDRTAVKCYSGSECEITIPYPDGCQLHTIYLPTSLEPVTVDSSQMSYDATLNGVSFAQNAGTEGSDPFKASTASSTDRVVIAISKYRIAALALKVDPFIEPDTEDVKLKPSAQCGDQTLELPQIPIELIREFNVSVYETLAPMGQLHSGQAVILTVLLENKSESAVMKGDLYITPPEGSVFTTLDAGCGPSGSSVICRIADLPGEGTVSRKVGFNLPVLETSYGPTDYEEFSTDVKFVAPGFAAVPAAPLQELEVNVYGL